MIKHYRFTVDTNKYMDIINILDNIPNYYKWEFLRNAIRFYNNHLTNKENLQHKIDTTSKSSSFKDTL